MEAIFEEAVKDVPQAFRSLFLFGAVAVVALAGLPNWLRENFDPMRRLTQEHRKLEIEKVRLEIAVLRSRLPESDRDPLQALIESTLVEGYFPERVAGQGESTVLSLDTERVSTEVSEPDGDSAPVRPTAAMAPGFSPFRRVVEICREHPIPATYTLANIPLTATIVSLFAWGLWIGEEGIWSTLLIAAPLAAGYFVFRGIYQYLGDDAGARYIFKPAIAAGLPTWIVIAILEMISSSG